MEPPNKGHFGDNININSAVVSFVERLSSFKVKNFGALTCVCVCVCVCVRDGCGRGSNKLAGRVQNHHVRFRKGHFFKSSE